MPHEMNSENDGLIWGHNREILSHAIKSLKTTPHKPKLFLPKEHAACVSCGLIVLGGNVSSCCTAPFFGLAIHSLRHAEVLNLFIVFTHQALCPSTHRLTAIGADSCRSHRLPCTSCMIIHRRLSCRQTPAHDGKV